MKFDSLSRIVLVAAVAAALSLSAEASGHKHHKRHQHRGHHGKQTPAHVQQAGSQMRSLDGQNPPHPAPADGPKVRHKHKLPPHRPPHPGPKPTPPGA